jgi:transposase
MLQLPPPSRIFVATEPVDVRKDIDGLAAVCRQRLGAHPLEGAVDVCRNRAGTALKLLLYDGQGSWMLMQSRSPGRCRWWPTRADARGPLSARELLIVLGNGKPERAQMACDGRRGASGEARLRAEAQGSHAAGSAQPAARCAGNAPRDSTAWTPAERQVAIRLVRTLAMEALGACW